MVAGVLEARRRKLVAILAADAVGSARLMAEDEAAALAALDRLRRAVLEPALETHGGRLFKTMGDGFLAEFASTVDALRCALAVQAALSVRGDEALRLRIGVHVGDVAVEGDDLLGDGVNLAARLQALADPGGIALSARVREDAAGRITLAALEDLGECELKNIPLPVRVFRLPPGASPAPLAADRPRPRLAALDHPALAVLPFANMTGDPEQEYFADGITEELITQLSRARWFYVIARNSSFTYKGRAADIRDVGRELGVRYVLEGSVRKAGSRVRISGQLIEAETGRHVWADRFDGTLDDIFELQDRVTEEVVGAIEPSLQQAEVKRSQAKPTGNISAYDLYLQALPKNYSFTREGSDAALALLRRAVAGDPGFAQGKAFTARCHSVRLGQGWASGDDVEEGIRFARDALAGHNDDPITLRLAGHAIARLAGDHDEARAAMERARAINPNSGQVALSEGLVYAWACEPAPALAAFGRAMRLSPLDPEMGPILAGVGSAHLIARDHAAALEWGRRSVRQAPRWAAGYRVAVAAYWLLGQEEEARAVAAQARATLPDLRANDTPFFRDPTFRAAYVSAQVAAGLPP